MYSNSEQGLDSISWTSLPNSGLKCLHSRYEGVHLVTAEKKQRLILKITPCFGHEFQLIRSTNHVVLEVKSEKERIKPGGAKQMYFSNNKWILSPELKYAT